MLYDKIVIMMNENVYFPMYLPQNCPVAQKMLITHVLFLNPVAVMFSFIRGDIAVGEFGCALLYAPVNILNAGWDRLPACLYACTVTYM